MDDSELSCFANIGLIKNEFDHDQLFCNFMVVPDQGWNSNYIMYY